jgi:hypothetical protein
MVAEPPAGAELGGSETRLTGRPRSSGSFSAIHGQAPMLAGSSWTQTICSAAGYLASSACSSASGSG